MDQERDLNALWKQVHHKFEEAEEEVKFAQSGARIRNRGNGLLIFEPRDSPQTDESVISALNRTLEQL